MATNSEVQSRRLPKPYGMLINRNEVIEFQFENRHYQGFLGDNIASALAANNQWLLSRSFKYHRARGALTMAAQDANTLVQLPTEGNVLADRKPIESGLKVTGQNYEGSLEKDRGAILGHFSKFMPVGFYYKAFFKPRGMWEKWAPFIRKKAGLGQIDQSHEPGYFDKQYRFYDVAVIGGGPAGLSAALEAANQGAEVLLVDENPILGGSLNYARLHTDHTETQQLRNDLVNQVQMHDQIDVYTDSLCNGWFADNWLALINGQRLLKVRAKEVVLCAGSLEQQALFHNNDLPGVMMSSAAQRLIRLYAVAPGKKALVLTGNNEGYGTALDLIEAGIEISALVDMRAKPEADYDDIARLAVSKGIRVMAGQTVYEALPNAGKTHIAAVNVRNIVGQGLCADKSITLPCDLLCMSVGYTPTYQLACHAGGQLGYNDDKNSFTLTGLPDHLHLAGSVAGYWSLQDVIAKAKAIAQQACDSLSGNKTQADGPSLEPDQSYSPNFPWPMFPHPKGKEFVDFDEDLQIADIVNATRDGYEHVQLVKRYSTCGMGPSQGRHSALATARLVAQANNKTIAETGVTTARPPFAPERIAHNAGRSFYPARRTNMHYRHLEAGAQMLQAGAWYRPAYYGKPDQRQQCIDAEVNQVREQVGIVDVSTLGGLELRGPDAGEFLNRFYTFEFTRQAVGRARYALLTNEAGVVIDDGVACRFHEQHYYVTATTGGVDRVYQSMLKWNAQWGLDVDIANVTSALCGVNIAGPKARAVLEKLCPDMDLSAEAFPYMGVREGEVAGIPARLIRVGFVGELGYELHVPQQYGEALWDALLHAGEPEGIRPFGIEAQRVLRLEKGHVIIGQDTDAMSTPQELEMGWAIARKKPFFVGGRTLMEINKQPLQRVLAGFIVKDASAPIPLESHLVLDGQAMVGRVTSCNYSPTLKQAIGMAYIPPEQAKPGSMIQIKSTGGVMVSAQVTALPFYDPDNQRQKL